MSISQSARLKNWTIEFDRHAGEGLVAKCKITCPKCSGRDPTRVIKQYEVSTDDENDVREILEPAIIDFLVEIGWNMDVETYLMCPKHP